MPEAVTLRERLRARAVLGTFVQTPHPVTAEFLSGFGLDFLCIDAEHAAMGVETVQALVAAAAPVAALVRVAENSAAHVGAALDSGAAGVLVPPGELGRRNGRRRAVRAVPAPRRARCRSRPRRRLRPLAGRVPRTRERAARRRGAGRDARRARPARRDPGRRRRRCRLLLRPRRPRALARRSPRRGGGVRGRRERIRARALAAGRTVGAHANGAVDAAHWLARGAHLLTLGSDLTFLAAGLVEARGRLEELTA